MPALPFRFILRTIHLILVANWSLVLCLLSLRGIFEKIVSMRVRKLVTLPVRLPLKLVDKLAPNLKRWRADRASSSSPEEECPICHDPVGAANPEGTVESWTSLHCGHKFGDHCLQTWIQDSLDREDPHNPEPTCPICRSVAKHPTCGHSVCAVPTFEMAWQAWQRYQQALMEETLGGNLRPTVRPRNRLQRREGHPSRPTYTPPRRMADTVGECTVCAEISKRKAQEKRILSSVQTGQAHEDVEVATITRKSGLLNLRRNIRRANGEPSSSAPSREERGRSMICNTSAPRIPTPVPVGDMTVGNRRISTVF
ncbi:hypothetical protein BJ166DRAFT_79712 [Pestalotiopsis sp. NC0098]|nr:hypothetical protein BJ166DRAFT_79712 [Pestalotiopsis sp. NC0098]